MKEIKDLFVREIERLNTVSKERALDQDEIKALVALTTAWKSYNNNEITENEDLSSIPLDELLALMKDD